MATTLPTMGFAFDAGGGGTAWTRADFATPLDAQYATSVVFSGSTTILDLSYASQSALSVLAGQKITAIRFVARIYATDGASTLSSITIREDRLSSVLVNSAVINPTAPGTDQTFNATIADGTALATAWSTAAGLNLLVTCRNDNDGPSTFGIDFVALQIDYVPAAGGGRKQTTVLWNWDYACQKGVVPTLTSSAGVAVLTGIGSITRG